MKLRTRFLASIVALAVVPIACGGDDAADGPLVVATTTVLGDITTSIIGDSATVEVLMPIGADPHDFEPSSRQAALLQGADLVVAVGLGLEEGLEDLLAAVEDDGGRVLRVGPLVEPDWLGESIVLDPHVWMDPIRMALAGELIADELDTLGIEGPWSEKASEARAALEALDAEIREILDAVPTDRRLLVTGHESLGYFAGRYGFEVLGAVVQGGSSMGSPSSADLSDLIARIEDLGVPAVFGEVGEPSALLDAIAAEPGLDVVVVPLHVGSLGEPGSGADSYIGMMRTDAELIAQALSR